MGWKWGQSQHKWVVVCSGRPQYWQVESVIQPMSCFLSLSQALPVIIVLRMPCCLESSLFIWMLVVCVCVDLMCAVVWVVVFDFKISGGSRPCVKVGGVWGNELLWRCEYIGRGLSVGV